MAKRKTKAAPDWEDQFADKFAAQPAQITPEQRELIDARLATQDPLRRLALEMLTRTGAQLIETASESRDNALQFARGANYISDYAAWLRNFANMLDTASMRLNIALCSRPDMQTIFDEVKAVDTGQVVGHG